MESYPLVHSERLTHYLANLLKQERREGRLEAAERVMDRCECWDEESQECQWCMVAREIRAQ